MTDSEEFECMCGFSESINKIEVTASMLVFVTTRILPKSIVRIKKILQYLALLSHL